MQHNNKLIKLNNKLIELNNKLIKLNNKLIKLNNKLIKLNNNLIKRKNKLIKYNNKLIWGLSTVLKRTPKRGLKRGGGGSLPTPPHLCRHCFEDPTSMACGKNVYVYLCTYLC